MALTIIYVAGPGSTGKSATIREFTARRLKYKKAKGDVRGIFQVPRRDLTVGVNSAGDNLWHIKEGLKFLNRYKHLTVMIIACRSDGRTIAQVQRFANRENATLHPIPTTKVNGSRAIDAAINANVAKINRLIRSL